MHGYGCPYEDRYMASYRYRACKIPVVLILIVLKLRSLITDVPIDANLDHSNPFGIKERYTEASKPVRKESALQVALFLSARLKSSLVHILGYQSTPSTPCHLMYHFRSLGIFKIVIAKIPKQAKAKPRL